MGSGNKQLSVVLFGSYDAGLHPRVAVLRDGLEANGADVRELNAPLGLTTADKVAAASSARRAIGFLLATARSWMKLIRRRRGIGRPDVVVVGYLGHLDVHLAALLFPRSVIVLDHLVSLSDTMRDRGLGRSWLQRLLGVADRAATAQADLVVVDTGYHEETLPPAVCDKAVVVPVGARAEWVPDDPGHSDDALRVVFFGLYTPLQGASVIGEAISLLAGRDDIRFTMVGSGQDLDRTKQAASGSPNVEWLDWVDSGELPALVAGHDVCLGIFDTGDKAARVVPTKVYQGLAAGCAVVTGDTPAARYDVADGAILVETGNPKALADVLEELRDDPSALLAAGVAAREASQRFTPSAATAVLIRRLGADNSGPSSVPLPPLTVSAWLRWDVVGPVLESMPPGSVLEFGPGEGAVGVRIAQRHQYLGVEPSDSAGAVAAARLDQRNLSGRIVSSTDQIEASRRFDAVCAFEVLEHIEDDLAALRDWAGRLRPGGTLVLSVPAGTERMAAADHFVGHYRRYDAADLEALLRAAGFEDVCLTHIGFPVGYAAETVRNAVASRRMSGGARGEEPDKEVSSASSGSFLQPPALLGKATAAAAWPGRVLQRRVANRGTGLVAVARLASGGESQ